MKDPLSLSALFSAFGNDLATVSDKQSLLQLIATHLTPQLTFSDILLSIANEDKQTHSVFLHHCDPARQDNGEYTSLSQEKFRMDDGVCNITMASPSPLMVDIAGILLRPAPPRYIARWYRPSISRMIGVRLRSHNQLLGALFFFFEKAHIGVGDLELVQHFSYMMAPALKNILADERASRQQQDNEILLSLGADLMAARDRDELFQLLDIRLRQLFEFDQSRIFLAGEAPFDEGMTEAVLHAGHPLVFDLDSHDEDMREVVMTALRKEGESFGSLALFSKTKGRYTSRHLDILRILSHQLSGALTNFLIREAMVEKEHDRTLILSFGKDLASTRNKKDFLSVVEQTLQAVIPYEGITISLRQAEGSSPTVYLTRTSRSYYDMDPMVAIPLRENNKEVGTVVLHLKEKAHPDERTLALLQGLGDQIAIGMASLLAHEKLEGRLEEAHDRSIRLEEENRYLQTQIRTAQGFEEIIGSGSAMQKVFQLVSAVSPSESTVLIVGEKGTGKELIAKAIHNASTRKDKFMIKIDCASLPADLLESELPGKFELADDSTLFLDGIGELSPELQARLLQVIRERAHVRIIAATHRDLRKEVEAGRFRSDLFDRLNVFPIHLPAVRERKEDLPSLINHFIHVENQRTGKKIANISQRALESLMRYDWPGNVRELEHLIQRSVLMTAGHTIKEVPLPMGPDTGLSDVDRDTALKTLDELERDHILAILEKCHHKVGGPGGAAELLRLPATTLHSKIKKLGIKKEAGL